jgi:hypothetical protein
MNSKFNSVQGKVKKKAVKKKQPTSSSRKSLWTEAEKFGADPVALANGLFNEHTVYDQLKKIADMLSAPESVVCHRLRDYPMSVLLEVEQHLAERIKKWSKEKQRK